MNLPAYPKYKPSGVEWLGEIPESWEVRRLKFVVERVQTGTTPPSAKEIYYDEPDTLWFTPVDFGINGLVLTDSKRSLNHLALEDGIVKPIPEGSIMIIGIGATLGKVAQAGKFGASNQQINTVFPSECILPSYLLFFLSVMQEPMKVISNATTLGIMNQDKTKQIPTTLPPKDEQQTIIDYLDQKTGQIDGLIGRKKELIERLKEQRTAIITAAVTGKLPEARGLRAEDGGKMKDSGVEWLGDVPEYWIKKRLRWLCQRVTDGSHISPDLSSEDFPFVSTVDIKNGEIDFTNCLRTSADNYGYLVRTGCKPWLNDVLFSKDGTVGRTTVVRDETDFVVASSLVIITPVQEEIESSFLEYFLNNSLIKQEVELLMAGSALRRISVEKVGRLDIALPLLDEQQTIVDYLDKKTGQIDGLVAKATAVTQRLEEYRTAVITAAVTGKVKVDAASCRVADEQEALVNREATVRNKK